jgi:hypothetical protein
VLLGLVFAIVRVGDDDVGVVVICSSEPFS